MFVTLCYFFVDRQAAFFVHDHQLNKYLFLKWLSHSAMMFNALAPVILVLAGIRLAWGPLSRLEATLVAAAVSLMVAVAFEYYLKFLFGRYWPETWIHKNPSLIGDGQYGFHPFHFGEEYGSFPSGHTARVFAVMSVVWIVYPMWRWLCAACCAAVIVGLVGMNYHFAGDTIGGAFLGSVTGMYIAAFFDLGPRRKNLARLRGTVHTNMGSRSGPIPDSKNKTRAEDWRGGARYTACLITWPRWMGMGRPSFRQATGDCPAALASRFPHLCL